MKKIFDAPEQILETLKQANGVFDALPFFKNNFVKVPIRTKEQAIYTESHGKKIFVEEISYPNGNKRIIYYCLMNYDTAIAHCL